MIEIDDSLMDDILEISSEQRMLILSHLSDKKLKLSELAKKIDTTSPEVHRNLERLTNANLIKKDNDGLYMLSTYGETFLTVIPTISFMSKNKKYFTNHTFGNLPTKFIQRIGSLSNSHIITGVSNVLETWKDIFGNSKDYIYGILYEEPLYLIEPIINKAKEGIKIQSIFSDLAIVPKGRKELLEKLEFNNILEQGCVERKIRKDVQIVVVMNEKESSVMFPTKEGVDMSNMFFSDDPNFHEWCLDYFRFCWYGSEIFSERKFK